MSTMVGGIDEERLVRHAIDVQAGSRAAADPLPGPLAEAFKPLNIQVEGFTIRPLVAWDWAIMKTLNSPIYRQMLEVMQLGDKAEQVPSEPSEMWELIYLLTRPCEEADKVFQRGADAFRDAAKREIGFKLNLGQVSALGDQCINQIYAHMETMVKYAPKESEGTVVNFQQAEKDPTTVSAGG